MDETDSVLLEWLDILRVSLLLTRVDGGEDEMPSLGPSSTSTRLVLLLASRIIINAASPDVGDGVRPQCTAIGWQPTAQPPNDVADAHGRPARLSQAKLFTLLHNLDIPPYSIQPGHGDSIHYHALAVVCCHHSVISATSSCIDGAILVSAVL